MAVAAAPGISPEVRPVPPPGITLPSGEKTRLLAGIQELNDALAQLKTEVKGQAVSFLPDIEVFEKAVRYAVIHNEFYNTNEIPIAYQLLDQAKERAGALRKGQAPWNHQSGLIARGYRSRIDGSVQPYGLVVPASYQSNSPVRHRLDVWFHGRGENLTELNFLNERQKSPGEFTRPNAFVLHAYGRYCNANKFAGEIDLFEALDEVRKRYPIDENRLVVRGFSMGGAACWQFAVHFPGLWAAAAPGAGFAETANFLKVFQNETVTPPWYEQKLWRLYDCTGYAVNLFNCPTVAYSGELDKQKQAADIMAEAMEKEGLSLIHVIGPQTAHKYHPDAIEEINRRIDSIVNLGRNPVPPTIRFVTWTLRYNQVAWLTVDSLDRHWDEARVDAELLFPTGVRIKTKNVAGLTLTFPAGYCPLDTVRQPVLEINGARIAPPKVLSDRSWKVALVHKNGQWTLAEKAPSGDLRKVHGLQGPIDDAFMDSFVMVKPGGQGMHSGTREWIRKEQEHAIDHWRRQFRGDCRVMTDDAISEKELAAHNLILWGDPQSNQVLAKLADKLPIRWDAEAVVIGPRKFASSNHVPVMIYPNPLNPRRYIVLNSGFTFREYDYLNNARQVPKLPDYAVMDVQAPITPRAPGKVVDAGFFDENWQLPSSPQ